ncbi:MAG: hypothetical protein RL095_2716 [Verrucomicrobiota bacterium]|jgi:O-antigen ligase
MPPETSVFLRFTGPLLWLLAAFCLYFAQPFFLGEEWSFAWPVAGLLGLAGLAVLASQAWQGRGRSLAVLLLALGWVFLLALSMLIKSGPMEDAALLAAPFCGGLALAVCRFSSKPERDELALTLLIGSFWWLNLILCLKTGRAQALFGNPNWFAASLLAALPWGLELSWRACLKGLSLCRKVLPIRHACALAGPAALLLSLPPFLVALWCCKCRMAWAALALLLLLRLALGCPLLLRRVALVGGLFAVVAVLWFQAPDGRTEIRPHLWKQAAALTLENPLLGGGPGSFQKGQPALRTIAHGQCSNYAEHSPHPHNEILHWAVQLGIPAALCGLALLALGLIHACGAPRWALAAMFLCSLVDMPMSRGASSVLAVIFIGLALRPSLAHLNPLPQTRGRRAALPSCLVAAAILAGALQHFRQEHGAAYLAHKASRSEDAAEAAALWRQAAEKAGDNPAYWHQAARILIEVLDQPFDAIEVVRRGQALAPDYGHFHLYAGILAEHQSRISADDKLRQDFLAKALASCRRHLVTHPGQPEALAQWRNFCLRSGRFAEAARAQEDLNQLGAAELIEHDLLLVDQLVERPDDQSLRQLFSGLRGPGILDPLAANLSPRQMQAVHRDEVRLLLELKQLRSLAAEDLKTSSPEDCVQAVLKRLKMEEGSAFSFPADTLASGKASQISAAALLQVLGTLRGHRSWIAQLGDERLAPWICVWEIGEDSLVIGLKSRSLSRVPLARFRQQAQDGKIASCPLKNWRVCLFEYPPLLLHRQQALQLAAHRRDSPSKPCLQPAGTTLATLQLLLDHPTELLPQGLDWEPRKQP